MYTKATQRLIFIVTYNKPVLYMLCQETQLILSRIWSVCVHVNYTIGSNTINLTLACVGTQSILQITRTQHNLQCIYMPAKTQIRLWLTALTLLQHSFFNMYLVAMIPIGLCSSNTIIINLKPACAWAQSSAQANHNYNWFNYYCLLSSQTYMYQLSTFISHQINCYKQTYQNNQEDPD